MPAAAVAVAGREARGEREGGGELESAGEPLGVLEGSGDDARAQVKFGRHGVKWLALSVAKLTPVG